MEISNNIFDYATKELSQDAFLCWLCSFATKEAKENEKTKPLYECAVEFIKAGVEALRDQDVEVNCIQHQWKNIDVLLTVNDKYKIIVEDKTNTKEHDNQLERYKETVTNEYGDKYKVCGVFYKTGFQSDLSEVEKAKYVPVERSTILEIMDRYDAKIQNDIWRDYYSYLKRYEEQVKEYKTLPVKEWSWYQINGFYDTLKKEVFQNKPEFWAEYGYVANQNVGFMGMWIGKMDGEKGRLKKYKDVQYELYLQMEFYNNELRICLKVSMTKDTYKKELAKPLREFLTRDEHWHLVLDNYNFPKPPRFGTGRSMTIGVYDAQLDNATEAKQYLQEALQKYCEFDESVKDCVKE